MLKINAFTGINNVADSSRLDKGALTEANNVDIDRTGQILRRHGYTSLTPECHRNLWQGNGFLLATTEYGDLVAIGEFATNTIINGLGHSRVWYVNLPDGRTAFSNGAESGITDGITATGLGVEPPPAAGNLMSVQGDLFPGKYQWWTTYVRLSDGEESGTTHGGTADVPDGGVLITGLPLRAGHKTNVYLSGADGDMPFFAGEAAGPAFSYTGKSDTLTLPCRTQHMVPMPVGTIRAFWRGRVLVAVGNQLVASRPHQFGLHDPRRDFKQFAGTITGIVPVDGGIFVGTDDELAFIGGATFDTLTYSKLMTGRTVLGSAIQVPGSSLQRGDGVSSGDAMLCITNGRIVAGYSDGGFSALTEDRYHTSVTEVFATFREYRNIPQYLALPT